MRPEDLFEVRIQDHFLHHVTNVIKWEIYNEVMRHLERQRNETHTFRNFLNDGRNNLTRIGISANIERI